MIRNFSLFLLLLLFISCGTSESKPAYLWEEEKFEKVLTEVQLAESLVRLGYHRAKDSTYHQDSIFSAVFRKMNVTKVDFDSNYQYHMSDPENFELIMDKVLTNLSVRSATLVGKAKKENVPENSPK